MKNYTRKSKMIKENEFGLAQLILNQCIICSLILFGVLILNFTSSMKKFRTDLKMQLSKNISIENVKNESVCIFNSIEQKFSTDQDYYVDEKVLEQIQKENEKMDEVKKNSPAPL